MTSTDLTLLTRLVRENFRDYALRYALAMGLMGFVAVSTGYSAWIMRDLVNEVFINRDAGMMYIICFSVGGLYIARGFASYFQEVILARIGNSIIARMQKRIFDSMLGRELAFFQEAGSSDLITRITFNAQAASGALNLIATSLGRDLVTVVSLIYVMAAQDGVLTLIALIGSPLLFVTVTRLLKQMRKLFSSEVKSMASIISAMQETVHGIRVVRAFRLEGMMRSRLSASVEAVERLSNKMAAVQAGTVPLIDTLGGVAVASVVFYGGWQVIYKGLEPGGFFAFITALLMLTDPTRRLARLHLQLAASAVGVKMIYELVDHASATPDRADAVPLVLNNGTIALSGVTFGYRPDAPVLHDLTVTIEGGKITALVGLSGSGKSTMFNLCLRFWEPQKGEVLIDGQKITAVTAASLYDAVAVVNQDVFLFEGTIAENIAMGRPGAGRDLIEAAAKAAAAHGFILDLPNGYDTQVGEFGGRLSGGQRQRISIARAFLKNAPILLLDEPTSALDAESDALVQEALRQLMKGRTTLMIAHRFTSLTHADRILVLDEGRLVEAGTQSDLLAQDGIYKRLYELQ